MKVIKKLVAFIVLIAIASTIAVPVFAANKKMVYVNVDEILGDSKYYKAHHVSRKINPYASKPYADIGKPGYGCSSLTVQVITYLKKHKAFKGVIKGNYFNCFKKVKRKEFIRMLINLYGKSNVPITAADRKKANKSITLGWARKKLASVAKRLGVILIDDSYYTKKLTRLGAANCIEEFCTLHKRLRPRT